VFGLKSKKAQPTRASPEAHRRMVLLAGSVLVCSAILTAAGTFGVLRLWRAITRMPEFRLRPVDELRFESDWIRPDAFRAHLCATDPTGTLGKECSMFDPRLAERVAVGCAASPYARAVHSVSKVFPNHLRIAVAWREPCALVHDSRTKRYYVVDEDGVVLSPRLYDLSPGKLAALLPVVEVAGARSAPAAGRKWDDIAVREGIAMLRLYRTHLAGAVPVRTIEVEGTSGPAGAWARAWLTLEGGARVYWGRTPSSESSVAEPSPEQKVVAFRTILQKERSALGGRSVIYLNLPRPRIE